MQCTYKTLKNHRYQNNKNHRYPTGQCVIGFEKKKKKKKIFKNIEEQLLDNIDEQMGIKKEKVEYIHEQMDIKKEHIQVQRTINSKNVSAFEENKDIFKQRDSSDSHNLFRLEILKVFPNVKTIIMVTTTTNGETTYSLSLSKLLSTITKLTTLEKVIVKACTSRYRKNNDNWISFLWNSSSSYISQKYKE
eukprot:74432_1